jgi:electron transfer flavoprotein alpha subunit
MADVLAIAEQRDGRLRGVSNEALSAGSRIASATGGAVHALLLGGGGIEEEAGSLGEYGAERIHVAASEDLAEYHPDLYAHAVAERARAGGYGALVFAATAQGKDLAPRVAARLDVPLASDVTGLETEGGSFAVIRPVYAGKAFATVDFPASPALISIRPNAFQPQPSPASGEVETYEPEGLASIGSGLRVKEYEATAGETKDVAEASIVVSGGRGMKDPENWGILEDLRAALGADAALGASRAAVDAGWRPHAEQVGQTGKTVAPKLYFAVGISGAIQHLAGMRTSQTIVAVNKDPDAPIFQTADYGIVGDLFQVVPRLTEEIRALKSGD